MDVKTIHKTPECAEKEYFVMKYRESIINEEY